MHRYMSISSRWFLSSFESSSDAEFTQSNAPIWVGSYNQGPTILKSHFLPLSTYCFSHSNLSIMIDENRNPPVYFIVDAIFNLQKCKNKENKDTQSQSEQIKSEKEPS